MVLVEKEGYALLSCDPGRDYYNSVMAIYLEPHKRNGEIWLYDYVNDNLSNLKIKKLPSMTEGVFRPLGIEIHEPSSTVYIANIGPGGPKLEIFKLDRSTLTLTYKSTFAHADLVAPNSIHALNEHSLIVSQDHFWPSRQKKFLAALEVYLTLPLTRVLHIDLSTSTATTIARQPFGNGVAVINASSPNPILAIASSSRAAIYLYTLSLSSSIPTLTVQRRHEPHPPPHIPNSGTRRLELVADV